MIDFINDKFPDLSISGFHKDISKIIKAIISRQSDILDKGKDDIKIDPFDLMVIFNVKLIEDIIKNINKKID
jgi:hypothetical protein